MKTIVKFEDAKNGGVKVSVTDPRGICRCFAYLGPTPGGYQIHWVDGFQTINSNYRMTVCDHILKQVSVARFEKWCARG